MIKTTCKHIKTITKKVVTHNVLLTSTRKYCVNCLENMVVYCVTCAAPIYPGHVIHFTKGLTYDNQVSIHCNACKHIEKTVKILTTPDNTDHTKLYKTSNRGVYTSTTTNAAPIYITDITKPHHQYLTPVIQYPTTTLIYNYLKEQNIIVHQQSMHYHSHYLSTANCDISCIDDLIYYINRHNMTTKSLELTNPTVFETLIKLINTHS